MRFRAERQAAEKISVNYSARAFATPYFRRLTSLLALGAISLSGCAWATNDARARNVETKVGEWLQSRGLLAGGGVVCDAISNPRLAEEIISRYEADQALRSAPSINEGDLRKAGVANGEFLEGVFYGLAQKWPDACLIGLRASDASLILLQHYPDVEFRKSALKSILDAAEQGVIRKAQIPMIVDRIALEEGRPQEFGTQLICGSQGQLIPAETAEPRGVDKRRERFNLPPLNLYVELLNSTSGGRCHK